MEDLEKQLEDSEHLVEIYSKAQVWYSNAIEQLGDIRYEYSQLLERFYHIPNEDRMLCTMSKEEYERFVAVADKVNEYFSKT